MDLLREANGPIWVFELSLWAVPEEGVGGPDLHP